MPRQAQESSGAPFAKLVNLGDLLVGGWGGNQRKQQRDYESGDLKWKEAVHPVTGERLPMLEEVNWFVAMPGTTAHTGTAEDGYEDITEGDIVRYSFAGFKWGSVIEARKLLPAVAEYKIRRGREASSDVYDITLAGWSKETKAPEVARKSGFTVENGRIILRSDEDADKCISWLRKQGVGNLTLAKDIEISVRRVDMDSEKQWADAADELYDSGVWNQTPTGPDEAHRSTEAPVDALGDEDPF